jgi:hypothetical protein
MVPRDVSTLQRAPARTRRVAVDARPRGERGLGEPARIAQRLDGAAAAVEPAAQVFIGAEQAVGLGLVEELD